MTMKLSEVLRQYRWAEKRDLRSLAKEIGVSASTLLRIESGKTPNGQSLSSILLWLLQATP